MESGADIGAHSPQGVPHTQGNVGHGEAQIDKELHDHIDAASDNTKARLSHAGGLCYPVTQGHQARHKGNDSYDNPSDRGGQQGRVKAVLGRRSPEASLGTTPT